MISVIMSAYNDENSVKLAIDSILNQNYQDFEFLIMDDFSTDNTFEICKDYSKLDERIIVYRNDTNLGLTKSLNKLLEFAKRDYIARQDSDDISLSERFNKQINFISENRLDGSTTRAIVKNSLKVTPNKSFYFPKKLIMKIKNPFIHGSLMLSRNSLESIGGYNEKFYYAQDYKLLSDLLSKNFKLKILKEEQYILNLSDNISTKFKDKQKYYADCVRKGINPIENMK
tara:strand:+ start:11324 stop:12010 length:687 start_codon:yes stop_codon:yes gene_type:complete